VDEGKNRQRVVQMQKVIADLQAAKKLPGKKTFTELNPKQQELVIQEHARQFPN